MQDLCKARKASEEHESREGKYLWSGNWVKNVIGSISMPFDH